MCIRPCVLCNAIRSVAKDLHAPIRNHGCWQWLNVVCLCIRISLCWIGDVRNNHCCSTVGHSPLGQSSQCNCSRTAVFLQPSHLACIWQLFIRGCYRVLLTASEHPLSKLSPKGRMPSCTVKETDAIATYMLKVGARRRGGLLAHTVYMSRSQIKLL